MKLLFLFVFASGMVFSQSPLSDAKKLYTAFHDIDLETVSEMLCSNDSKEEVYKKLDAYFLSDESKFRYVQTNAKYNISPKKIIGDKSYHVVDFRNVVRVTYFKPIEVGATQKSLKEKFNAQSINYDKNRNAFLIVYTTKMIVFSESDGQWKFLFDDNTIPRDISESCIDTNVKKDLGL